jgi:hypothetical protein
MTDKRKTQNKEAQARFRDRQKTDIEEILKLVKEIKSLLSELEK